MGEEVRQQTHRSLAPTTEGHILFVNLNFFNFGSYPEGTISRTTENYYSLYSMSSAFFVTLRK
jgi:hypothetical protein